MAPPDRVHLRSAWLVVAVLAAAAAVVSATAAAGLVPSASTDSTASTAFHPTGFPSPVRAERPLLEDPVPPDPVPSDPVPEDPGPQPMARSAPVRVRIPSIGLDSRLMDLGLRRDGTLETPPGGFPAGWFTGAPTPGELGPAIIAGHVRYITPGVFERLSDVAVDDLIVVRRKDGSTARFRVSRVKHFAKSAFPTRKVYGDIDHPGLRLITCGGLDARTNRFDENVVVFADLV